MKLSQLFERRSGSHTSGVDIEYEYESQDENGDYASEIVRFGVDITVTDDAYNTGDSPTDYEAVIDNAEVVSTGKSFDWKKLLSKKQIESIKQRAIEKAQ